MQNLHGLTTNQADEHIKKFGKNILPQTRQVSAYQLLISQFASPLVYVLLFAGVVTTFLQDYTDTIVIFAAVLINTILGFYQEFKAQRALSSLQNLLSTKTTVIRDGKKQEIDAALLVPGDIIVLTQGDRIPADAVVLEGVNLTINEALLTGEAEATIKKAIPIKKQLTDVDELAARYFTHDVLSDGVSCVYMGTTVVAGRGVGIVVKTGSATQMGKIAQELIEVKQEQTPLQRRVAGLARQLTILVVLVSFVLFIVGIMVGNSLVEMFTTSVALAVAMIPEGMLVSLTVILALGMQKILKKKALVRKLVAAETLGSVTVIATDKTGTLTKGMMKVVYEDLISEKDALYTAIVANDLEDPLEIALWEWAEKKGMDAKALSQEVKREKESPFDSVKKYMSVTIDGTTYIKGAPEVVLNLSTLSKSKKDAWHKKIAAASTQGLRLIALAKGHTFLGLLGIKDEVRDNVEEVFARCVKAGIRIIMITGDYPGTAGAVWKSITKRDAQIIDGTELEKLSDEELQRRISSVDVYARVSPTQKLRIVTALQREKEIVALVGDGVNDAPALKKADIGIVVGDASDVARETADMVLLDSNFNTIVAAIEEGRGMFQTVKKVIMYLLSDSFSEVVLIMLSFIFFVPLPITASQILFINLVTDGFPNVALTAESKEKHLLRRPPIPAWAPLVDTHMKLLIAIIGLATGIMTFFVFRSVLASDGLYTARSIAFATLGTSTLLYIFSVRHLNGPAWGVPFFSNPYLLFAVASGFVLQFIAIYHPFFNVFLETEPLTASHWVVVMTVSVFLFGLIEVSKAILRPSHMLSK